MGLTVENEKNIQNEKAIRLTVSFLCTVLLFISVYAKVGFYLQFMIYLFLLYNVRNIILAGFTSLSDFSINVTTIVFICTLFALLHGLIVLSEDNLFAYAAMIVLFFDIGEYSTERAVHRSVLGHARDKTSTVLLVMSLAFFILTLIVNLVIGSGFTETLVRAFSVLVVSCPCSFAFVLPLSSILFVSAAKNIGISVITPQIFKRISGTREIIFDQRGIITAEKYSLFDIYSVHGNKLELLSISASMENESSHAFAKAIVNAANSIGASFFKVEKVFDIPGRGVGAELFGDEYFLGNKSLFKEKKIQLPELVVNADAGGYTPLYLSKNGEFIGVLFMVNRKLGFAESMVKSVSEIGLRVVLLAEGNRKDLKNMFDIMITEREKVLHEFKKGDKIKAMVVSRKPIAIADVVATTTLCKEADIILGDRVENVVGVIRLGRKAYSAFLQTVLISIFLSLLLTAVFAFGVKVPSLTASFVTVAPLICMCRIRISDVTENTSLEEDLMFGKVNYSIRIDGMSCAHCSARVKTALESMRGVSAKISLEEKTARVKCPAKTTAEELAKAITDAGFTVVSTERV